MVREAPSPRQGINMSMEYTKGVSEDLEEDQVNLRGRLTDAQQSTQPHLMPT